MAAFNWTEHFVTGLGPVDGQHRHLIEMTNGFGESLSDNALDFQKVESLLKELADYAPTIISLEGQSARETASSAQAFSISACSRFDSRGRLVSKSVVLTLRV